MDKTRQEGKFTQLAFTGPKGGTGKTTLAALITEYLNKLLLGSHYLQSNNKDLGFYLLFYG